MKLILLLFTVLIVKCASAQVSLNFTFDTPYGSNEKTGKYVELNGNTIYYEEYGSGDPLLLIHGNGGDISWMGNQIDFFKKNYRVIVADNRGHGKSGLKTDSLTYVQIAEDWQALAKHLQLESPSIIGWSDGGIIALIMGINNEIKLNKIVSMAANLRPDSSAVYPFVVDYVKTQREAVEKMLIAKDETQNWNILKQHLILLGEQPNISNAALSKINAEVLVVAGDEDIIKGKHSLEIYQGIPKAQLCIIPGATHFAPASSPKIFNEIVQRFLIEEFKRPDSDFTKW